MSESTPGSKIAHRLWEAKAAAGKPMEESQVAAIIDGMIKELGLKKPNKRVNGRDLLFDGLCVACGVNPSETTRPACATIGTALADIAAVTIDLTPEEFGMRAARYRKNHPDWELTPSALATHWGELGEGDLGRTLASQQANEPVGWQNALKAMLEAAEWDAGSISVMTSAGWTGLSLTHRKSIHRRLGTQFANQPVKPYAEVAD